MGLISEKDREELRKMFSERLDKEVEILLYKSKDFRHSEDAEAILNEVKELSDKIKVTVHEGGEFKRFPVITFRGHENIVFEGLPSGYEFVTLIEDIMMVSSGHAHLPADVESGVKEIGDTEIKVFITPTCPYCPKAVIAAHKFAFINPKIRSVMVESLEFPDYASEYNVMAVPKVVINDKVEFEGAYPEEQFFQKVLEAQN